LKKAIGQANTASGTASMTFGANNIASGNYSQAKGNNANTFLINGRFAWASTGIGATGDAQSSKLMLIKRRIYSKVLDSSVHCRII